MNLSPMNINRKYITLFSIAFAAGCMHAQAQSEKNDSTLNRTVVVENEYNPQIMDANKINMLPAIEEPKATKKPIEYALNSFPFSAFRYRVMPAYGNNTQQPNAPMCYLNLGYGNNGNVTGELNYWANISKNDKLNLNASFDGTNFEPDTEDYAEWNSRFYQSEIKADYTHLFHKAQLNAKAWFGTQVFNYLPLYETDKQSNMLGGARISIASTQAEQPWQYALEAGIQHFGRSYLYGLDESNSETNLQLQGNLSYGWDEESRVGIKLNIDQANYSFEGLENSGLIGIAPYYELNTDYMHLHLGAKADISTGFKSGVNISPDVTVEFPFAGQYTFYVQAKGGALLNDFFRFNSLTPYWGGYAGHDQMENTHVQLDAFAGLKSDLGENFWVNFFAGYELRKHEIGFYPTSIDNDIESLPYSFTQGKGNNLKAGLASSYQYKDLIDVSLDATYRNWSTDDGMEVLLCDKPELDVKFELRVHPTSRLNVLLGYQHRTYSEGDRDALANLYTGADYRFFNFFSLWVKAANLTNSKYQTDLFYPAQGINFMIGTSFRF